MKMFIVYLAAFAFTGCINQQPGSANKDSHTVDKKLSDTNYSNEKNCYANYSLKDTVKLELVKNENIISGTLSFKYFGKDENIGTFAGVMRGDTLVADYTFMSEGVTSVRQIAFIKLDNTLVEGYGDVEEKNGEMVFKNIGKLNFKDGAPLVLGVCGE